GDADVIFVGVVEDDPVIPLPVGDGGQRHLGQVALGSLYRAGCQAQLLGTGAQRPQARAVGARVEKLPDPRKADGPSEVTADHRPAGRAAIHLVDLAHVREATAALASPAEAASGRGARPRPP